MTELLERVRVWRPYTDPPILTAAMAAGPDEVPGHELATLSAYLDAVIAARAAPVHVNVAFNAAYFGYDLDSGGYAGGPLDLDTFPTLEHSCRTAALPVGAMVGVRTGAEPLYGEVVYREGAHPSVGADGSVPAWLSGAPAGATDPATSTSGTYDAASSTGAQEGGAVTRSEKLVLDFDAFGAGFSATPVQLARLRRQHRWLDERGHASVDATYTALSADSSESEQYQRFLLTTARDQVLSVAAPLPLSTVLAADAGPEDLAAALSGMFATVAYVLSRLSSARLWGGYAFSRSAFSARLGSTRALGGDDLAQLALQLGTAAAPPRSTRRVVTSTTAYTAVGPLLEQISGAAEHLQGVGYATVVTHASTIIGDYARRDADPDTALLPGGVYLRVDDTWQHGGVWRAQRPGVVSVDADVTEPLGLGWLEASGRLDPQPEPEPDPQPEPEPEPEPQPEPEPEPLAEPEDPADEGLVLNVTDSQVMWTQTLRLAHLVDSYLPVPSKVAGLWSSPTADRPVSTADDGTVSSGASAGSVADRTEMRMAVHHDGYDLDPDEASQAVTARVLEKAWSLTGMAWPLEFFPGLRLICTWQRGGRSVRVTSTLLDFPVTVDGDVIEHRYDPAILTRDNAGPEPGEGSWKGRRPGGVAAAGAGGTWPARVLRAVRRAGLLDVHGRATLPQAATVSHACGDPANAADTAACAAAVDELVAQGKLARMVAGLDVHHHWVTPCPPGATVATVLVYAPAVVVSPVRRAGVPSVLQGLISTRGLDPRKLLDVEVSPHLRRLQPGHQASQAMRDAYREQRETYRLTGPAELPPDYTFVRSFHRGA